MNRLYAVENRFTTTGGMADHRFRCAASQIPSFAVQLAKKVAGSTNDRVLSGVVAEFKDTGAQFDDAWLTECANDLVAKKGRSLVLARQPVSGVGARRGARHEQRARRFRFDPGSIERSTGQDGESWRIGR